MQCQVSVKLCPGDDRGDMGFGKGIVMLLERIERFGSINRATADMGMAYSKAWKIINETEREFGVTLIDRAGAHGSTLTEEARSLLRCYREMRGAAQSAAQAVLEQYYPAGNQA